MKFLAGDIGGTKTVLALYILQNGKVKQLCEAMYKSADFDSLERIVQAFYEDFEIGEPLPCAAFGVAGPVIDGHCKATNLPWEFSEQSLCDAGGFQRVHLLNDLQAAALGMLKLPDDELYPLNLGQEQPQASCAVIAAGTGLGQALLIWDGSRYLPMATEGGHSDFAPQDAQQDALLGWLREQYPGHVSYERILSGPGFCNVFRFLRDSGFAEMSPELEAALKHGDVSATIAHWAEEYNDALCLETQRLFARVYGAEAGNLVLKSLAYGGVYIAGGIAPKMRAILDEGEFMHAFTAKGRFADILKTIPVHIAMNPRAPLIGAAAAGQSLVESLSEVMAEA